MLRAQALSGERTPHTGRIGLRFAVTPWVALTVTFFLGAGLRLLPVLLGDFPINDGGLFYLMARELQEAHYALPRFTAYNQAHIPFAYPPLALYGTAALADSTGWSLFDIIRIAPGVWCVLTLPAFFALARSLLGSRERAITATLIFAALPGPWLIMGGGITRAPGFLFAILAIHQAYNLVTKGQARNMAGTAVLAALTLLTHPHMAVMLAYSVALLLLFFGRGPRSLILVTLAAFVTAALAAPWWGTVLLQHGSGPFVAALHSRARLPLPLFLAVGSLIILVRYAMGVRSFLVVWSFALIVLEPQLLWASVSLTVALISAVVTHRARALLTDKQPLHAWSTPLKWLVGGLTGAWCIALLCFACLVLLPAVTPPAQHSLTHEDRDAMRWVAANLHADSTILVLPIANDWSVDPVSEWFPALTGRTNLLTAQGYEWLPDQAFTQRNARYDALRRCVGADLDCVRRWADQSGLIFTYLYIPSSVDRSGANNWEPLRHSLASEPDYTEVYSAGGTTIFAQTTSLATTGR